jgi:hypothetical protein
VFIMLLAMCLLEWMSLLAVVGCLLVLIFTTIDDNPHWKPARLRTKCRRVLQGPGAEVRVARLR